MWLKISYVAGGIAPPATYEISAQVGIRKVSIHYPFLFRGELGKELVMRYRAAFQQKLEAIELSEPDPRQQLQQFVGLYRSGLSECQMCLCGMFSLKLNLLPDSVQEEVRVFLAVACEMNAIASALMGQFTKQLIKLDK